MANPSTFLPASSSRSADDAALADCRRAVQMLGRSPRPLTAATRLIEPPSDEVAALLLEVLAERVSLSFASRSTDAMDSHMRISALSLVHQHAILQLKNAQELDPCRRCELKRVAVLLLQNLLDEFVYTKSNSIGLSWEYHHRCFVEFQKGNTPR